MKKMHILMVDDHPMIIEGYKRVLMTNKKYDFNIKTANSCDTARKSINWAANAYPYDMVFIDIQLPPSKDGEITSGEGLALLVRKKLPNAKIVILTMHGEPQRVKNIKRIVEPDGFLIKSDINAKLFLKAFKAILNRPPYYSELVEDILQKSAINDNDLDDFNQRILFHLGNGVKTKNLVDHIPLSLSAIEKRKSTIKQLFNINGDDEQLLKEAKKRGYI